MYSNYLVPPACFLPYFYNNQTKLLELCSDGLPPVTYTMPPLIATSPYQVSGDRYAGSSLNELKTYLDKIIIEYAQLYKEEINKFAENNIRTQEPISESCLTVLYMHNVECEKENESFFASLTTVLEFGLSELQHATAFLSMLPNQNTETGSADDSIEYQIAHHMPLPGQKYALQAYEFIKNSTKPESAMLADQFLSEYHIQVLHELRDAESSLPVINALNPMAHPSELKALVETLRGCLADQRCEDSCLAWDGEAYRENVFECINKISSTTCVDG